MLPFPVTESTLSAQHLGRFLQERYAFGGEVQCKLFRTGINHSYMITDGDNRFVFRMYTYDWRTKTEIAEEARLLLYLKEHDIPVSYPIADNNGIFVQEIQAPEGLRYGMLFSFAEGRKVVKFTAEASYEVGVAMARMHRITEHMPLERIMYNIQTLLTDPIKRTRSFFTKDSDETAFLEQATRFLTREYEQANTAAIRHGMVHLDIWFDNMHFADDGRVTFFDFDFCGNGGWQCHDIGYFLYQLYSTNQDDKEYERKREGFMKGYESVTRLTEEERRILPVASLCPLIFFISVQCEKFDTWSNVFLNEEHLKRYVASLKRWVAYNGMVVG